MQLSPVHPMGHVQMYPPIRLRQVPPLEHTLPYSTHSWISGGWERFRDKGPIQKGSKTFWLNHFYENINPWIFFTQFWTIKLSDQASTGLYLSIWFTDLFHSTFQSILWDKDIGMTQGCSDRCLHVGKCCLHTHQHLQNTCIKKYHIMEINPLILQTYCI